MPDDRPATIDPADDPVPGELHIMNAMDPTGDTKVIWNPQNDAEVRVARNTFDQLKAAGYLAYRVLPGGDKGEVLREFDASAEKIIMAPAMQGGGPT